MDNNQIGIMMSGDPMAIMNEIDTGKMTANSVCPFPYNQPILNYLILYGRTQNPEGAAKSMKYVIEQGADVNFGAPNGVSRSILQCYSYSHSQGFKDDDLGNSPGWWAATVVTYCPGRPLQLTQKNITKHGERVEE